MYEGDYLNTKICPICGRELFPPTRNWAYKEIIKGVSKYYCSYSCFNKRPSLKEKKEDPKYYIKVNQYDLNGKLLNTYKSLTYACELNGFNRANITRACNTGEPYMGYLWEFAKKGD